MKLRAILPVVCLLIVLGAAVLRPRLSPIPLPLPVSPRGVTLIAVHGLDLTGAALIARRVPPAAVGLMPTRNGTANEADFEAGLRMALSGSRSALPDAPTLPDVAREYRAPLSLHSFSESNAPQEAAALLSDLSARGALPDGTSVLIFGVTPSTESLRKRERVAPVLYFSPTGGNEQPGLLTSPSTRYRAGLLAATDIAATAAALIDLPVEAQRIGDGRPARMLSAAQNSGTTAPDAEGILTREFQRLATIWGQQAREQKLLPAVPWLLAALFAGAAFFPTGPARRASAVMVLTAPIALIIVAPIVPVGFDATPFGDLLVFVFAATPAVILAALAFVGERWAARLPRLLAVITASTIAVDACLGGFLLGRTPFSYSVLEAARFYGIGNEVSGLFLGAAVLGVGAGVRPVEAAIWGLAAAIVLGAPTLGADAGGLIAAIVAFAILGCLGGTAIGAPPARKKVGLWVPAAACIAAIASFAIWDGSRPTSSRTHIGQAVATVRETGPGRLTAMAERKIRVNVRLLTASPWAVLLFTQVAAMAWKAYRRKRQKLAPPPVSAVSSLRLATFAAMLTLLVLNDSGVVAAATCGCWLLVGTADDQNG